MRRRPPRSTRTDTLFPYTTLFRSSNQIFSPVLLDVGGTAGSVRGFSIPNNQAFNPFGNANGVPTANALAFWGNIAWPIRKLMTDVGHRNNLHDFETRRIPSWVY